MKILNDETIRTAVGEWIENSKKAEEKYSHISDWNVSKVTNMKTLFLNVKLFNEDIGNWDVSNVTDMERMFFGAESFNQDLGKWNVSKVTNMKGMFGNTKLFNQDIGKWNVSKVTNMNMLFHQAESFNQDISNWNVSNVTNMQAMFYLANSFNQNIGKWNVSNVINMKTMFFGNKSFNQDISNWDVSKVTDMESMFCGVKSFNQDISNWDVSRVRNMYSMFYAAESFNQDTNGWGWSCFDSEEEEEVQDVTVYFEIRSVYKDDDSLVETASFVDIGLIDIYDDEQTLIDEGAKYHKKGMPIKVSHSGQEDNYYIITDFRHENLDSEPINWREIETYDNEDDASNWISNIPTITYSEVLAKGWIIE